MLLKLVTYHQRIRQVLVNHLKSSTGTFTHLVKNPIRNMSANLNSIPKVDIDPSGVFKYILIKVHDPKSEQESSVTIVRGYGRCEYHADILDVVQEQLKDCDCECLGGGRISHQPKDKKIHIYGYSQGYGKADHEVAAKLVKEAFPGYKITISDEGY